MARGNIDQDQIADASKHGTRTKLQTSDGTGTVGHTAAFDATGALTDGGAPGSGGPGVLGITIDGGGSAPTTGSKGYVQSPYGGTITGWTILADQSGSCQITVKKSTYSGFPTTASIVASAQPKLISVQNNTSTTLTGWTTAITAGDILEFNLDSVTSCRRLTLELNLTKS